jgi:hypothetical protein
MYAGPWRRQVADRMWALVLVGEARLRASLASETTGQAASDEAVVGLGEVLSS